jgi:hypothetical protein
VAQACARVDSGLDKAKISQTVVSTRIVSGCVQFLGEEKRFYTVWVIFDCVCVRCLSFDVCFASKATGCLWLRADDESAL